MYKHACMYVFMHVCMYVCMIHCANARAYDVGTTKTGGPYIHTQYIYIYIVLNIYILYYMYPKYEVVESKNKSEVEFKDV